MIISYKTLFQNLELSTVLIDHQYFFKSNNYSKCVKHVELHFVIEKDVQI